MGESTRTTGRSKDRADGVPSSLFLAAGFDLAQQPRDPAPLLRMHRQHVDDVGPFVASLVAVAEQLRGDPVAVGLVADQDAAAGSGAARSCVLMAQSSASSLILLGETR